MHARMSSYPNGLDPGAWRVIGDKEGVTSARKFSLDEDDVPQVALKPATRERPKSMPLVSSAPQASPGLRGSSTMPTMTDMLASKRRWTAKLRDLEHATLCGPVVQIIQPQIAVATVAKLFSFLSAAMASTGFFCYFGVASNSVVLILPVRASSSSGSLAIMSRNIISGSLRMYCGVVYSLFIGFGLAIGAEAVSHDANGPWWPRTKSLYWAFLTVPGWNKEMVTAEFCVGSTLKHPNIIATVDIVSDPAARPQARAQAQARRDHARRLGPRPAAGRARTCSQHELATPRRPSEHVQTHSGGSAGALADELGSPRCLQIQNAQPVFKNTVTLPVMGLLTTDSPTEAEMDRNSTELLPLSPREPYTDLTFPSTPSSHTDDLPTPRVGTMPLAVPMSPPRTRVATFNAFHTVHVKQAAD
ncbi:hypothetical protein B0H14DRAFT_3445279 [Mycena olivaceomarginata]|nr:hypothetical protein B0H14DRAFT_3445279 [Mycena olivaceomarginata]